MSAFLQGFHEELEKIAQSAPEETFASAHPSATVVGGHLLYPPLQWAPGMELKGRIAERGGLQKAPWAVRHPILFPALAGLGGAGIGAAIGAGLGGGSQAEEGALYGAMAGGGLGLTGGHLYGSHKAKKYLEQLRRRQSGE